MVRSLADRTFQLSLVLEQGEELRDRRLHLASARLVVAAAISSGKARIGDMSKEKPEEDKKGRTTKFKISHCLTVFSFFPAKRATCEKTKKARPKSRHRNSRTDKGRRRKREKLKDKKTIYL